MDSQLALGLWTSNFGAVKIESNPANGEKGVMGVWLYDRSGEEVIGYFAGELRGNVLEFTWHEPGVPSPLTGAGFISFQNEGQSFSGRWWSGDQRRNGLFTGQRAQVPNPSAQRAVEGAVDASASSSTGISAAPAPVSSPDGR